MPSRPRHSRWQRLPAVFRTGEHKLPVGEPQRLTLYLLSDFLDLAELQAARAGVATIQQYCTELLEHAIDSERIREQVAELESRRGSLEGLHQIANDPEYLAEWNAQPKVDPGIRPAPDPAERESQGPQGRGGSAALPCPAREGLDSLSPAAQVVMHHAGQASSDPLAFLPCLRRGESVALADVADLARSLHVLETELRGAPSIDRRLSFALHRLAYESQVLHTDAWPGTFDAWTVDMIRAVQEAVERILLGHEVRYDPPVPRPENPL